MIRQVTLDKLREIKTTKMFYDTCYLIRYPLIFKERCSREYIVAHKEIPIICDFVLRELRNLGKIAREAKKLLREIRRNNDYLLYLIDTGNRNLREAKKAFEEIKDKTFIGALQKSYRKNNGKSLYNDIALVKTAVEVQPAIIYTLDRQLCNFIRRLNRQGFGIFAGVEH